jgi:NAD(P)H-hydrate epimerase
LDPADPSLGAQVRALACGAHLLVDAIFGTGLRGEVLPSHANLIEAINGLAVPILAVDIPSGLDCDTGRALGAAIRATYTVTFVALKRGFASPDAKAYTGQTFVASIGIDPRFVARCLPPS